MKTCLDVLQNARGKVEAKAVQRLACQMSWAAGFFPWVKRQSHVLWSQMKRQGQRDSQPTIQYRLVVKNQRSNVPVVPDHCTSVPM